MRIFVRFRLIRTTCFPILRTLCRRLLHFRRLARKAEIPEHLEALHRTFLLPAATASTQAAQLRVARKELVRLERQLERLAGREAELQQQISQRAADPAAFRELDSELRAVLAAKDDLETRWLEVADSVG